MGKAARNRETRKRAYAISPTQTKSVARALRRHGRMPLAMTSRSRIEVAQPGDLFQAVKR